MSLYSLDFEHALELLADCRLEERASVNGATINHPTKLNQEQDRILAKLNLEYLVDPHA